MITNPNQRTIVPSFIFLQSEGMIVEVAETSISRKWSEVAYNLTFHIRIAVGMN